MFMKTVIALGAAVVLATALGSAASAQTRTQSNAQEWWRAYQPYTQNGKRCIHGEESATSAYPSWMHC